MHHVILHLALIPRIGPRTVMRLYQMLGADRLEVLYQWTVADFVDYAGFSHSLAQLFTDGLKDKSLLEKELMLVEKHKIFWADFTDDAYPALLKTIHAPPLVLYWRGKNPALCAPAVALVGSRQAGIYARRVVDLFVPDLVAYGWAITSGGARGADGMAHEATLRAGGCTCAVIGSGLLRPYPACHVKLFERIIESSGSLVSSFPLTMEALPGNFPARNRIIAGMSRATVVLQAAEKSGARITALYALEEGREVCAVPGDIMDPLSAGCHRLVLEGATLVTSGVDVLKVCGAVVEKFSQAKIDGGSSEIDPLVKLCSSPQSFDDLLGALSCDASLLHERLFNLQVEGLIEQDFSGKWCSC